MTTTIITLCVIIVVLTLIAATAIYMVVLHNTSRYETHREFEIRNNLKYGKPQEKAFSVQRTVRHGGRTKRKRDSTMQKEKEGCDE